MQTTHHVLVARSNISIIYFQVKNLPDNSIQELSGGAYLESF